MKSVSPHAGITLRFIPAYGYYGYHEQQHPLALFKKSTQQKTRAQTTERGFLFSGPSPDQIDPHS